MLTKICTHRLESKQEEMCPFQTYNMHQRREQPPLNPLPQTESTKETRGHSEAVSILVWLEEHGTLHALIFISNTNEKSQIIAHTVVFHSTPKLGRVHFLFLEN